MSDDFITQDEAAQSAVSPVADGIQSASQGIRTPSRGAGSRNAARHIGRACSRGSAGCTRDCLYAWRPCPAAAKRWMSRHVSSDANPGTRALHAAHGVRIAGRSGPIRSSAASSGEAN